MIKRGSSWRWYIRTHRPVKVESSEVVDSYRHQNKYEHALHDLYGIKIC